MKKIKDEKTHEKLIFKFKEINSFVNKNKREPSNNASSPLEYSLYCFLAELRKDAQLISILKSFDSYNLLD